MDIWSKLEQFREDGHIEAKEALGGLPTPRLPAEIVDGIVTNREGVPVDDAFRLGADRALEIARRERADWIILQSRSPSCGVKQIYDGTFSGRLIPGRGVFAELALREGFRVSDVEDVLQGDAADALGPVEPPLCVRILTPVQIRRLYAERLKLDFPPDELKPLDRIERALARGEYICYGASDGDELLAYAFFVIAGRRALVDYYAVMPEVRDRGIGSRFIRALIEGPLADMDCVLLEVDDPDHAEEAGEASIRERRLAFYLRNGLCDTGVRARVFGVDFRILSLPVGERPSPEQTREVYAQMYRIILPPKLYSRHVIIDPVSG